LRVLVLFAHPVETSFAAALHAKVVEVLRAKGHEVDDCDLNPEGFDPVMSRQDRIDYHNLAVNRRHVAPYVWTVSWPPKRSCFRSRSGIWDFRRS
jgi:NAD(P)H dehydrogenase (quinone)